MKSKTITMFFIFFVVLFFLQSIKANCETTIGFIFDGPSPHNSKILNLFQNEINTIMEGEFDVVFPENKVVISNWDYENIANAVDIMLSDPNVDIVIAAGVISSYEIANRKRLQKPVIASFIIDNKIQGIPITEFGTSGIHNLSYITSGSKIEKEFKVFYEIVKFKKLAFLYMDFIPDKFPELAQNVLETSKKFGVEIDFIPAKTSAYEVLALIPDDADAVYISPLLTFSDTELKKLIRGINDKKLPSFSLMGRPEVEKGTLIGLSTETDFSRLARRVSLNLQDILLGVDAGDIPVEIKQEEQLTINMQTAREINFFPSWHWLTEADLLNEEIQHKEGKITLKTAVTESVRVNLDLLTSEAGLAAGAQNIKLALSELLPQSVTSLDYALIDKDRAELSFGTLGERTLSGSIGVDQVIINEPLWSNYKVQKQLQKAREFNTDAVRLDIIQATSIAYLNVLRAKTFEKIQKENLKLTKSNLEIARTRNEIGVASLSEVYRWESELATDKIDVVDAEAVTKKARVLLNRLLHRPLNQLFDVTEEDIHDPSLLVNDSRLDPYIDNPGGFKIFMDYMVQVGLDQSPELGSLNSQIKAQNRILKSTKYSFWLPSINFGAEITQIFDKSGAGSVPSINIPGVNPTDDTEWNVLLSARFPLFRGGAKIAEYKQAREELTSLRFEIASTKEKVEENIRNSMYDTSASYPSIKFSQDAAKAAQNNLELVVVSYTRGVVSILDLLDAQNAALSADSIAATAVYDFIIDLMNVQRSVGKSDFFYTEEEREEWFENLDEYFKQKDEIEESIQ